MRGPTRNITGPYSRWSTAHNLVVSALRPGATHRPGYRIGQLMWRTVEAVIKIATNKPSKDIFQHIDGLDGPPHHSQKGDLAPQRAWTKPRNYSLYASGTKNRFTTRELFLTTNKTTISPTQRPLQGLGIGRVHTASPARTSPVRPKLPQRIPSFILREIKPIL
jgi:hypothetical protein